MESISSNCSLFSNFFGINHFRINLFGTNIFQINLSNHSLESISSESISLGSIFLSIFRINIVGINPFGFDLFGINLFGSWNQYIPNQSSESIFRFNHPNQSSFSIFLITSEAFVDSFLCYSDYSRLGTINIPPNNQLANMEYKCMLNSIYLY